MTYCIWRILAVCTPHQHQEHPTDHHTLCPRYHSCTPLHVPHYYWFHHEAWRLHQYNLYIKLINLKTMTRASAHEQIKIALSCEWLCNIVQVAQLNNTDTPWQRIPASSEWTQLSMRVYRQSISRLSDPLQATSSRWIGPLPCPKKADEMATAPV